MLRLTLDTVVNGEYLYRLIDTQNPNLLIVDTRPFSDYNKGHIPHAINIDLMNFHWFDTSEEGIVQFNRQMKILLNYLGVNPQSVVVFYDGVSGSSASRGIWLLNYFSHEDAYILDGGFENWLKSNYPVETTTNPFKSSESVFNINKDVLADAEYIKNKIEKNANDVVIIDCRSKMEYDGLVVRASRRGHIPHAINIDWINNLENEKFKDHEKLSQLYSFIPMNKEVITYCQGGYRAANTYLILKKLGYSNVKMYLGSWGEWGNISSLPIE
jgi:thiosulfate/3-mercaptopyruvate sulfurtransferase